MEALPTGRATSSVEAAKGVAHYHAIFGKAFIISQGPGSMPNRRILVTKWAIAFNYSISMRHSDITN